jgi:hypothetical protein
MHAPHVATPGGHGRLAAGCSSGHSAAARPAWARHPGIFTAVATARLRHPPPGLSIEPAQRIWVDTAGGRFRIEEPAPRTGFTAVDDGHSGTEAFGAAGSRRLTVYHGSRRFVTGQIGGVGVPVVRAFVTGSALPGVHVRVLSAGPPARLLVTTPGVRLRITVE